MNRSNFSRLFLVWLVLLLSISITYQKVFSATWVYFAYADANKTHYYYDKDSIMHISPTIKRVWVKLDKPIDVYLESRRKNGLPISGFTSYSYELQFIVIDCKNQQYNLLSYTEYATDGSILNSYTKEGSELSFIAPGSISDEVRKAICP